MQSFEGLGVFYLGARYDLEAGRRLAEPILYDSKDLTTHAMCVGMTGSGKTGLCLGLLEEAAIDGIPALVIDPKGDIANLLLTFPQLEPQDFQPWVNPEDAQQQGISVEQFAAAEAEKWSRGLQEWGQDGARIRRLREAVDLAIYTPGSTAGRPIALLQSFDVPGEADATSAGELIETSVTGLLGLLGIEADPLTGREHIFLSTLVHHAWDNGRSLPLGDLVQQIQQPPVQKIGVMDIESFFPAKERMGLAMRLNGLLASPSFASWQQGESLDVGKLLRTAQGKPRIAILSIAHLDDAQRMFFVALVLQRTIAWMRAQPGTSSLRALLYMDEVFGYLPPTANPPSKKPMLTLLKQARAFGVGLVLATQNPVDLDYKALSNMGTWLLGRLQTERDKMRVLDGLEGAAQGGAFDRARMERILAGLGKRVFLLHNVHEPEPVIMQTRWTLSYLRGPLTLNQIRQLTPVERPAATTPTATAPKSLAEALAGPPAVSRTNVGVAKGNARPVLPPEVPQCFLPAPAGAREVFYEPRLLGIADVHYIDAKLKIDQTERLTLLAPFSDGIVAVDWDHAEPYDVQPDQCATDGVPGSEYGELPPAAAKAKSYGTWTRDFGTWLARTQDLTLLRDAASGLASRPDETEAQFRVRVDMAHRELRDAAVEKLRAKYNTKIATAQERLRKAQQRLQDQQMQARTAGFDAAVTIGSAIFGAFLGGRNQRRTSTAVRSAGRGYSQMSDVGQAEDDVRVAEQALFDLQLQVEQEIAAQQANWQVPLDTVAVKPKKANVAVRYVGLAWLPQ